VIKSNPFLISKKLSAYSENLFSLIKGNNKLNIKTQNFYTSKYTAKMTNRQGTDNVTHTSEKGLVFGIYKDLST
jgi:hypothetical protein